MARRPDLGKEEILTAEQLKQLRQNLAHLSEQHVQDFYERAHQDYRTGEWPTPRPAGYTDTRPSLEATMEVAALN